MRHRILILALECFLSSSIFYSVQAATARQVREEEDKVQEYYENHDSMTHEVIMTEEEIDQVFGSIASGRNSSSSNSTSSSSSASISSNTSNIDNEASIGAAVASDEEEDFSPWSFLVLPDLHIAEPFSLGSKGDSETVDAYYQRFVNRLQYIRQNFGGEVLMVPGDTNGGRWLNEKFGSQIGIEDPGERVLQASQNCYTKLKQLFVDAGYGNASETPLLISVGDHELGDNNWYLNNIKTTELDSYRQGFAASINYKRNDATGLVDNNDKYWFPSQLWDHSDIPSRPVNTPYEDTTYAYQHKNVLFITVDMFTFKGEEYFSRQKGVGGSGAVTVSVTGNQLGWLETVLEEATKNSKDTNVDYIVVQGHIGVVRPFRTIRSSAQIFDYGEKSRFWKLLIKYQVDLYFAGDVHTVTATRMKNEGPIQIVSRGNKFTNFLKVTMVDTEHVMIEGWNERGSSIDDVNYYESHGQLLLQKKKRSKKSGRRTLGASDGYQKNEGKRSLRGSSTMIESDTPDNESLNLNSENTPAEQQASKSTALETVSNKRELKKDDDSVLEIVRSRGALRIIYNLNNPLLDFHLDQLVSLQNFDIIGFGEPQSSGILTVDGISCSDAVQNSGIFGDQYTASVANLALTRGRKTGEKAARFSINSRFAIYSSGPHSGGSVISYGIWFKTNKDDEEMTLVHYGSRYKSRAKTRDIFSLTLDHGNPTVHINMDSKLIPGKQKKVKLLNLADNKWHYVVVSMPRQSCLLSEVEMFVDGEEIAETTTVGVNRNIFFHSSGVLSLGGLGVSWDGYKEEIEWKQYFGIISQFTVWGRRVWESDWKI